ncbi:hypothetical protein [Cellulomonas endometrii]|uniref:hypothetical protein n=1 Tax=Cellulomonas endometrii TaxID=3036301 RepID=UPI0024AD59D5|nr:hypothetical protein [Cellulomonas endometrii]
MALSTDLLKSEADLRAAVEEYLKTNESVTASFTATRPDRLETYEDQDVEVTVEDLELDIEEDDEDATVSYTAELQVRRTLAGQDHRGDSVEYEAETITGRVSGTVIVQVSPVSIDRIDAPFYETS